MDNGYSTSSVAPNANSRQGKTQTANGRHKYFLGTLMLLGVVVLWVSSSFTMNIMFTDMNYSKPWLVTYLCTSSFTLYLIKPGLLLLKDQTGWFSSEESRDRSARRGSDIHARSPPFAGYTRINTEPDQLIEEQTFDEEVPAFSRPELTFSRRSISNRPRSLSFTSRRRPISVLSFQEPPLTTRETASLALLFCGLWFIANWTVNAAMGLTSVSSGTILSSMSGFFTLGVGALAGVDEITSAKVLSVAVSIFGVFLVSMGDHSIETPATIAEHVPVAPLLGDVLALFSAFAYACYVILIKVRIRDESRVDMPLFFGFVGLWNTILFWPFGFILHWSGVEVFELPPTKLVASGLVLNMAITFVSDALYLKAMLLTSPLAVTLGMSLTIPLAFVGDLFRGTEMAGWSIYAGGLLVVGSFILNGLLDLAEPAAAPEAPSQDSRPISRRPSLDRLL